MEPIRDGLICWLESADLNLNSTIWRDRTGNVEAELINFDSDFKQDNYLITKKNENYVKVYDNFNFLNKTITIALKKGDISKDSGIFGYWHGKNFFITGYPSQEKWGFIPNGEAINIVSVDRPLDYVVLTVTISSKGKVCIYHDSKKMIESEENTITITNPLHFFKKYDAPANGTDAKTGMILVYDRVLTEEEIVHNSTYEKLKNKAYINSNNLPKLVEKLTDASNIKISNNKYGNRVQTVIDKIVDKADNITKAINQEVINDSHTFKVGTGNNVNVSSDVQDSFSPISLKGNTYQNLIQNDNNNEVIPNEIITTEKDTIQTFKVNDGEINLNFEGQTYQNLLSETKILGKFTYDESTGEYTLTNPTVGQWNTLGISYTRPIQAGEKLLIRVNIIKNTIVTTAESPLKIAFSDGYTSPTGFINIESNVTGLIEHYCDGTTVSDQDKIQIAISTRNYTSGELVVKDIQVIPVSSNPLSYTDKNKEYVSTESEVNYIYSLSNLKANTTYTLGYEIKSSNKMTTNDNKVIFRIEKIKADSNTTIMTGFTGTVDNIYRKHKLTFNTGSDTVQIKINLRNAFNNSFIGLTENTLSVRNLVLLEGDYTNKAMITELPTSINGIESVAERESKNLLENVKWYSGWINVGTGALESRPSANPNAIYTDLIPIDINNRYYFNLASNINNNVYRIRPYDANKNYVVPNDNAGNPSLGNNFNIFHANRSLLATVKYIRILLLDSSANPLPDNPTLVQNIYTEGDINVKGTDSWRLVRKNVAVKPNTQYKISLEIESISKGSNNFSPIVEFYSNEKNDRTFLKRVYNSESFDLTTKEDTTILVIVFVVNNATVSTTECEANFKNIGVYESDLYPVRLTNRGKNLLDLSTFTPLSHSTIQATKSGNVITIKGLRTSDVESITNAKSCNLKVYLEEGKTYSVSFKSDAEAGRVSGTDTVEIFLMLNGTTAQKFYEIVGQSTFTIPKGFSGYYYVRFDVNSGDKTHKFWDIQVEEGSVVTDYEPYLNTTTEIPLPQPLRSLPNGIKDTIEGNKLVQRVDKIILDGSRNYTRHSSLSFNDMSLFYFANANINKTSHIGISSKLPCYDIAERANCLNNQKECIILSDDATGLVQIILKNTSLETQDVAGLKKYLIANPITLYYELARPIEHELNIPQMFEKYSTNIITTSNNIKPNFNIESKGYEYKALIKPSTQYTLMLNAKDGSDNLDFVLGGTKITVPKTNSRNLIQTSNTLTDSNLYIGGLDTTVNNVMLLEGDLREDENIPSYFEGIVGAGDKSNNLFDYLNHFEQGTLTANGALQDNLYRIRSKELIPIKKSGTYTLSYSTKLPLSQTSISLNTYDSNLNSNDYNWEYGKNTRTITLGEQVKYIKIKISGNTTPISIEDLNWCKLEEGAIATPYYDSHKIEILSTGKNLYKPNLQTKSANGLTFSLYGNTLIVNGTCTNTVDFRPVNENYSETLELFNYVNKLPVGTTLVLSNNLGLKSFFGLIRNGIQIYPFETLTIEKGDYNIGCFVRFEAGQSYENQQLNIQLEINSKATEFEPYQEYKTQILLDEPLMRLPNGICDEITKDGKLIKRIGKVILDGSESCIQNQGFSNDEYIVMYTAKINKFNVIKCEKISNCIEINTYPSNSYNYECMNFEYINNSKTATAIYLRLKASSTDEFIAKVKNNPITIYYELAEPIITEIPSSYVRYFKDGHLTFNTLVAPESTHLVQLNKSAQIENSIKEIYSLDNRIEDIENSYSNLMLENNRILNLLTLDYGEEE